MAHTGSEAGSRWLLDFPPEIQAQRESILAARAAEAAAPPLTGTPSLLLGGQGALILCGRFCLSR